MQNRTIITTHGEMLNLYNTRVRQQMQDITVVTTHGEYEFIGKHLPEMEKPNWHYYEAAEGTLYHFRKEHMICVISVEIDDDV